MCFLSLLFFFLKKNKHEQEQNRRRFPSKPRSFSLSLLLLLLVRVVYDVRHRRRRADARVHRLPEKDRQRHVVGVGRVFDDESAVLGEDLRAAVVKTGSVEGGGTARIHIHTHTLMTLYLFPWNSSVHGSGVTGPKHVSMRCSISSSRRFMAIMSECSMATASCSLTSAWGGEKRGSG